MKTEYSRTCATKAGRTDAAKQIASLAERLNIECSVSPAPLSPRGVLVCLAFDPYRCFMRLDGDSSVDAFLCHWHTTLDDRNATYPSDFGTTIRGSVNPYTFRKATTYAETLTELLSAIECGFRRLGVAQEEVAA